MAEPAMMTYQRIKKEKPGEKRKRKTASFFESAAGFLFASAAVYENLSPLGLAYLTKERSFKKRVLLTAVFVVIGNIFMDNIAYAAKYIAAEAIYVAILFVLERGVKLSFKAAALMASASLAVSGSMVLYWQGITSGGLLELVGEILLMIAGAAVFEKIRDIDFSDLDNLEGLSPDKRLALIISAGLMLMGAKGLYIGNSISVMNTAAALLILVVSAGTGASAAAVFGIWVGFVCGIGTDYFMPLVGTFGFCGFLCGLFSRFGKAGASIGLILANAVLIVYTNNAIEPMLKIYEILLGTAVFIFVPQEAIRLAGEILKITGGEKEKISELKDGIKKKLKKVSSSFKDMADTIETLSDGEEQNSAEIAELFDRAADKICKNCRRSPICWGKDFNSTYRALFSLLESLEKKGEIGEADFGEYIKEKCLNKTKLISEITDQFEIYKSNVVWKSRLSESRVLACQQISGMSEIINDVAANIDREKEKSVPPEKIKNMFKKNGIKVKDLSIDENASGRMAAKVLVKASFIEKNGSEKIRRILKKLMGREFVAEGLKNVNKRYKLVSLNEGKVFSVDAGYATSSSSEANGDSFMSFELECGKYVIILSDGMGTGLRASRESRAITELLNSFLSAGFNKSLAVKLINTVMIMKSEKEEFATIDMCIIDLYTGETEFIKSGAEPSYIVGRGGVETVTGKSLPLGIIPDNEPESFKRVLRDGDFVVMVTDGVSSKESGGKWIKGYIEGIDAESPDEAAQNILKKAREINDSETADDMTVISVKLRKCSALKSA